MWHRYSQRFSYQAKRIFLSLAWRHVRQISRITFATTVIKFGESTEKNPQYQDARIISRNCLVKNAAVLTLTSASGMLIQTLSTYIDECNDYHDALMRLSALYELSLQVLGNQYQENRVWDTIFEVKSEVSIAKLRRDNLQILLNSCKKVVETSAESAFNTGAENASIKASELMYSTNLDLKNIDEKLSQLELDLSVLEVKAIEQINKKNEEREKQLKEQEGLETNDKVTDSKDPAQEESDISDECGKKDSQKEILENEKHT